MADLVEPTIEARDVEEMLGAFFADHPGTREVRAVAEGDPAPFDVGTWSLLVADLGIAELFVPADCGGLNGGHLQAVAAIECAGAALYPGPLRSTVLAIQALAASAASPERSQWLSAIGAGVLRATVALPPAGPGAGAPPLSLGNGSVSGCLRQVADADGADLVIAAAKSERGRVMVGIPLNQSGVVQRQLEGRDFSHSYSDLTFDGCGATELSRSDANEGIDEVYDLAAVGLAAEQVGGAVRCLSACVEYASTRQQFGRPIGSFQAIQHLCAGLAVAIEGSRALLHASARAGAEGDEHSFRLLTPLARAAASRVFSDAADNLIHVHGGLGFTWEHDAHLYLRRARSLATWYGTPATWQDLAVVRGCVQLLARDRPLYPDPRQ